MVQSGCGCESHNIKKSIYEKTSVYACMSTCFLVNVTRPTDRLYDCIIMETVSPSSSTVDILFIYLCYFFIGATACYYDYNMFIYTCKSTL